jgi:hypothetical protein
MDPSSIALGVLPLRSMQSLQLSSLMLPERNIAK